MSTIPEMPEGTEFAFNLPGIVIDGKNGERLVLTPMTNKETGEVEHSAFILTDASGETVAEWVFDLDGEHEYQLLYDFFSPMSDGDVNL